MYKIFITRQEIFISANSIIAKLSVKNTALMIYSHHLDTRSGGFGFNLTTTGSSDGRLLRSEQYLQSRRL